MAFARLWRLKTMRLILLLAAIGAFNGYSILTWSPTFFIRAHGFTPGELGVRIAAATATGLIIGNLLAGWLADRLSASDPRWYMRVAGMGSLLAAPFVLAFLFLRDATWSLVALGSAQCLLTAFTVPTLTMALSLAPPQMRATTSMTLGMTMNLIGAGLGPLVVGVLNDALRAEYGPEAIRYSLCVVVVGLLACGGLAFRVNRWVADDLGLDARTADSN
jgi:MFS family permease